MNNAEMSASEWQQRSCWRRFCCILCALVSACASGRAVRGDVLTSGATDSQAEHKSTRRYLTNRNGSSQIVGVLISPFSVYI